MKLRDTEDPYCETGHNSLFIGLDGSVWSSCHYKGYGKSLYPYCPELQDWEKTPQRGIEPVYYKNGRFYILKPIWTEQVIEY